MYRKEVNEKSPLRILERSIHGGLGKGNLGVVMARAGVGKTAFLVHIGLDDAMRERKVLHVSTEQGLDHLHAWYDAIFSDMAEHTHLDDRESSRAIVNQHRVIQTYTDHPVLPQHIEKLLAMYAERLSFVPEVILIDGYDWEGAVAKKAAEIGAFKGIAQRLGAELWISAQTHREETTAHPTALTPPCAACADLIDVAVFLEPVGDHVTVRLLKDHGDANVPETHLQLDCDTLRLHRDDEERRPSSVRLPNHSYVLLSGANNGAEAAFGEAAEKWGVRETNYSFAGRTTARQRGVVELSDEQLDKGDVSTTYVESHLHRKFPQTDTFKKILRSIWYQVATAGQVFVVGALQDDGTVKGGTGWAAELAKHFEKPLYVFDQEKHSWFEWKSRQWSPHEGTPRIARRRFAGTGTRFLTDEGRAAIEALFEASFDQPQA